MNKEITLSPKANRPAKTTDQPAGNISKAALEIMENAGKIIYCPEKYFAAQKSVLTREIKKLYQSTPDLPIRQVVVNILSELPDFLPPDNILDVTRQIVENWQKLTEEKVTA